MVKNVDIYFALVLRGHKNLQSYFIHHVIIEKNFLLLRIIHLLH